jgi:ribonuclease D
LDILVSKKITKVFHSARQDCEALLHKFSALPCPIFDTQIAYGLLNCEMVIGYEAIVKDVLNLDVDKECQTSRWLDRPLSKEQIHYAAYDVIYLIDVYEQLLQTLKNKGREEWAIKESNVFLDRSLYEVDSMVLWKKCPISLKKWKAAVAIKYLMAWREEKAISINKPKGHIISDQSLFDICLNYRKEPSAGSIAKSIAKYSSKFSRGIIVRYDLITSIKNVLKQVYTSLKTMDARQIARIKDEIESITTDNRNDDFYKLKFLVGKICKRCAEENDISQWLFAPKTELRLLAHGFLKTKNLWLTKSKLSIGWRKALLKPFEAQIYDLFNKITHT